MGWSLDLTKYAQAKADSIKDCRRKVAVKLFEAVVKRTPVDTGRARGNWQVSVGFDSTATTDRVDKQPAGSNPGFLAEEQRKIESVQGDETIFIHNNLPYIRRLEYGHSKQSPKGMVGVVMANLDARIREAVKESGL